MKARYQYQYSIWDPIDETTELCPEVGCDHRADCMLQEPGPEALCFKEVGGMDEGFKFASCALSFFRGRHGTKTRYKNSKRNYEVPVYKDHVRMARLYICKAREAGFRGSVVERVLNEAAPR